MDYPKLTELKSHQERIDYFLGYNHNLKIRQGELYDMENLSSDYFPILAPRKRRSVYKSPENVQGLIAKEKLCYVDGA